MERAKKIRRCYRISPFVYDELKKTLEKINSTETNFVEIAIIEKIARIREFDNNSINYTNNVEIVLKTP